MNILQLCRIPTYPPQNGAAVRVSKTTEKLAELGDVWFAAPPGDAGESPEWLRRINLRTSYLTRSALRNEAWLASFLVRENHLLGRQLTNAVVSAVSERGVAADVVVAEFPQLSRAARILADAHDAKLLVNKHNAAYEILETFLEQRPIPKAVSRRAVSNLRSFERETVAAADVTVFQSTADRERFEDVAGTKTRVIPNGCEYEQIRSGGNPDGVARQLQVKRDSVICVFVGSYRYGPNQRAASIIMNKLAPSLPDIEFVLVGRDPPESTRENVYTPGYVDDLAGVLHLADVGLCPLFSGSGTKLKMFDYFAAGLPVIATPVSIQGIPVEAGESVVVRETVTEIREAVERLVESPSFREKLGRNSQQIAANHSWPSLMREYEDIVTDLLALNP